MNDVINGPIGRLNGRVTRWLAYVAAFALALIAVATFCDVVARYFFNAPFTFTVELTEISMALMVFLGVGLVTHQSGHITVDVLTLRLSDRLRALFALVTNLLALIFLALMMWQLWLRAAELLRKGDKTAIWGVPLWPVAAVMALGSIFLLTGIFLHLIDAFARAKDPEGLPPPAPSSRPFQE